LQEQAAELLTGHQWCRTGSVDFVELQELPTLAGKNPKENF
jgi:hypothetical protein